MPAPEVWGKFQDAVLWLNTGYDGFGQPVVSDTPEQIKVRWDDTFRQAADREGTPTAIEATISSIKDIPIGSLMWKGREADLPSTTPNFVNVMEVVSVNIIPDLKARVSYKSYACKRFKDRIGGTSS